MAAADAVRFPNYLEMRQPLPLWVWHVAGAGMVVGAFGLVTALFATPRLGLIAWWLFVLPVLPPLLVLAPGVWRNICPMATLNQYPRVFRFSREKTVPAWLSRQALLIQSILYFALISTRAPIFDHNGPAVGALMLVALGAAFVGGVAFKGKSGWCGTFCPIMPVQRLYGQTPILAVPNAHCRPCVGCTKNCYDFNPHVAAIADANDPDRQYVGQRKVFAALFPGFVLAFFTVPDSRIGAPPDIGVSVAHFYALTAVYMLVSLALFFLIDALVPISPVMLMALFGAIALNLHNILRFPTAFHFPKPPWLLGIEYPAVAALTLVFLIQTYRKERRLNEALPSPGSIRLGETAAAAIDQAARRERSEVTILPERRRIAVEPGVTLLEVAEQNDLPLEVGCRLGVCGADPVCVAGGGENLSAVEDAERATLERLGLAENTRMACCARVLGPVSMSLSPERKRADQVAVSVPVAAPADVSRIVVIGNGIAGITAADYVRRQHPSCQIDVVGREQHLLYNRMAITRLIYGRSAMQGLYLLPEAWYEEQRITCWLNTHVARIDRAEGHVELAMGQRLPYDRLILTAGSGNFVPPIDGFGAPGTFALRDADEAMEIRGYVQENRARRAVVVGGGLLGLEAASALHKLGMHVTVISRDRLLSKQLDEAGALALRTYLEGLGLQIQLQAEVASVDANDRIHGVKLKNGRVLPCDLLLVCTGIRPNVEVAREAGLQVNRGLVVDDYMRTSDRDILAAGDVAEYNGRVGGLWPIAVEQAKVAAVNALGGAERYRERPPVTILKVSGVDLTTIGRFEPEDDEETVIALQDSVGSRYRKLIVSDGRVVGAILLGYAGEAPGVTAAVNKRTDVTAVLDELRAGDWSFFRRQGILSGAAAAAS